MVYSHYNYNRFYLNLNSDIRANQDHHHEWGLLGNVEYRGPVAAIMMGKIMTRKSPGLTQSRIAQGLFRNDIAELNYNKLLM